MDFHAHEVRCAPDGEAYAAAVAVAQGVGDQFAGQEQREVAEVSGPGGADRGYVSSCEPGREGGGWQREGRRAVLVVAHAPALSGWQWPAAESAPG